MELLIFSDSHGKPDAMREAISRQVRRPDGVLFLGDGVRDAELLEQDIPWYMVRGNCDWFGGERPDEIVMALEGHTLLLTHGHRYSVKSGLGALLSHAAEVGADVVVYGHTHTPDLQIVDTGEVVSGKPLEKPIYLFNPGSIGSFSRQFGTLTLRPDCVFFSHGTL
ncbi:MAG: YfcE family phosphodiesterase [Clostridia bacterium]|nr:YfcE family phosphodiesterase [Clostridia bacterium]